MIPAHCNFLGVSLDFQGVRIHKLSGALKDSHTVALELRANHVCLSRDDRFHAEGKFRNCNVIFPAVAFSVKCPDRVSSELKNSFANALTGDGSSVDADSAYH